MKKVKRKRKKNKKKEFDTDIEFLRAEIQRREEIIREKDANIKSTRREGTLFRQLDKTIATQKPLTTYVPALRKHIRKGKTCEAVGLLLSDLHGDQEVSPEKVMGYENYNFDEFCIRAQRLVDSTVSFCFENMTTHVFNDLYIFGLGDYVSGEIHGAKEHSKWENAIKNAMGVGEIIGMMIQDFSKWFNKVHLFSVSGNHGRRTFKKDYHGAHDNWDYLVAKWACARCQNLIDNKQLFVHIPDSYSHIAEIFGFRFFMNHGDDMKSALGTPYYAIDRTTRNLQSIAAVKNQKFDYFLYGHWHKEAGAQITTGEWLVNGTFRATDEWLLHSIGGYAEPMQKIFGIHPHYGKTWGLSVNLKDRVGKPKRRYLCTII